MSRHTSLMPGMCGGFLEHLRRGMSLPGIKLCSARYLFLGVCFTFVICGAVWAVCNGAVLGMVGHFGLRFRTAGAQLDALRECELFCENLSVSQ